MYLLCVDNTIHVFITKSNEVQAVQRGTMVAHYKTLAIFLSEVCDDYAQVLDLSTKTAGEPHIPSSVPLGFL